MAKILGLDIGEKRTGIAISDDGKQFSFPLTVLYSRSKDHWINEIYKIVRENEIESILVGIPMDQFGELGEKALEIMKYIALIRGRELCPVIEWDERFTTVQAERALVEGNVRRSKRKEVIDKVAASILLQSYLDSLHFQT